MADTKWAIEYEAPAAEAFGKNHPSASVFCHNCNVILLVRATCHGIQWQESDLDT